MFRAHGVVSRQRRADLLDLFLGKVFEGKIVEFRYGNSTFDRLVDVDPLTKVVRADLTDERRLVMNKRADVNSNNP